MLNEELACLAPHWIDHSWMCGDKDKTESDFHHGAARITVTDTDTDIDILLHDYTNSICGRRWAQSHLGRRAEASSSLYINGWLCECLSVKVPSYYLDICATPLNHCLIRQYNAIELNKRDIYNSPNSRDGLIRTAPPKSRGLFCSPLDKPRLGRSSRSLFLVLRSFLFVFVVVGHLSTIPTNTRVLLFASVQYRH